MSAGKGAKDSRSPDFQKRRDTFDRIEENKRKKKELERLEEEQSNNDTDRPS